MGYREMGEYGNDDMKTPRVELQWKPVLPGETQEDLDELKKEYDSAFTQGFTSEQLKKNLDRAIKGDFQDDWQRELDERKQDYNASGRGIDFNKERTEESL